MPLPTLRPTKPATVATAPCVLFEFDGDATALDRRAFETYLLSLCDVQVPAPRGNWSQFAATNQLTIDSTPMCEPDLWVTGAGRWFAVEYPTASEAHLYFGRTGGVASKFTHLDLMKESVRWISRLRRKATPWRAWMYLKFVPCFGGVLVGGLESGISLTRRPSFLKTLISSDTALALLPVAIPTVTKSFAATPLPALKDIGYLVMTLGAWMLFYSVLRHLFIVPSHTWGIDGLGGA